MIEAPMHQNARYSAPQQVVESLFRTPPAPRATAPGPRRGISTSRMGPPCKVRRWRWLALLALAGFAAGSLAQVASDAQREFAAPGTPIGRTNEISTVEPLANFTQGSSLWAMTLGRSEDTTHGSVYLAQLQAGYYPRDRLAVFLGASLGRVQAQRVQDTSFIGPDFGLRWHWLAGSSGSLYVDGSAGMVFHERPLFSRNSLNYNFNLQTGLGGAYRIGERLLLVGGVRYHHLSNARIRGKERNIRYDAAMGYIGLMFR